MKISPMQNHMSFKSNVKLVDGYGNESFDKILKTYEQAKFNVALHELKINGRNDKAIFYPRQSVGSDSICVKVTHKIDGKIYEGNAYTKVDTLNYMKKEDFLGLYDKALIDIKPVEKGSILDKYRV